MYPASGASVISTESVKSPSSGTQTSPGASVAQVSEPCLTTRIMSASAGTGPLVSAEVLPSSLTITNAPATNATRTAATTASRPDSPCF